MLKHRATRDGMGRRFSRPRVDTKDDLPGSKVREGEEKLPVEAPRAPQCTVEGVNPICGANHDHLEECAESQKRIGDAHANRGE